MLLPALVEGGEHRHHQPTDQPRIPGQIPLVYTVTLVWLAALWSGGVPHEACWRFLCILVIGLRAPVVPEREAGGRRPAQARRYGRALTQQANGPSPGRRCCAERHLRAACAAQPLCVAITVLPYMTFMNVMDG
jgi:hypothetical protein